VSTGALPRDHGGRRAANHVRGALVDDRFRVEAESCDSQRFSACRLSIACGGRRSRSGVLIALAVMLALPASAGSRARYGGTLRVTSLAKVSETDPLLADTPIEATMVELLNRPLCRLERAGSVTPVLASELSRVSPTVIRFALRSGLARSGGASELNPTDVAQSLTRISASSSPYRALLAPLRSATATELTLAFPFPDLERSLCHPALAPLGVGPYRFANQTFTANVFFPEGRPYIDAMSLTSTDARTAERLLQQHKTQLALGLGPAADDGNLLYTTFLAFNPSRAGADFRGAFESAVERSDLTRFFVRAPAAPMPQLLPPSLSVGMAEPPKLSRPAPAKPPRELTLLYDAALDDHRAVAERIQVKLHAMGYRIALKPMSRAQLRAPGLDFDLMLQSVLMPPSAVLGLALAVELGGRHEQLPQHLAALGAIADDKARAHAAQQLAEKLWPELPLIPLYAQGLGMQPAREVHNLKADAFGLPLLDAVFLGQE
jgi:peptide/nickel transport system substrate-binding protein